MLTPEQEAEAGRLERALREATAGEVRAIAKLLAGCPNERLFGETEFQVRDLLMRIGNAAFAADLAERKKGSGGAACCPGCGEPCPLKDDRERGALTLFGGLRFEHCHYHCPKCRHGFLPLDAELGLDRRGISRGATEARCLEAAASGSIGTAARDTRRRVGLAAPANILRRFAE